MKLSICFISRINYMFVVFFCSVCFAAILPQKLLAEKDVLIFYHIPKTAGLTISDLLERQFEEKEICPDVWYTQLERRPPSWLNRFKLFRGHFFLNSNLKQLKNAKRIVFFREPIARVLSEQRYFESHFKGKDEPLFYIPHFLPPGEPIEVVSNHQCLFLSSFNPRNPAITPQMHLASAKENLLNDFFFVGITERLEESIQVLYARMGWEIPQTIPKKNVTPITHKEVSDQILEEIRQRNLCDIELYEFAKDLFEAQLEEDSMQKINID